MFNSGRALVRHAILAATIFPAAVFLAAPRANAFWITQPGGESVNGSGVTGCADVQGASTAQHTPVGFYPCNGLPLEQWTYKNGQIIGIGGNCLTINSSARIDMETCSATALSQQWSFIPNPTHLIIVSAGNAYCLGSSGKAGGGEQLIETGNCAQNIAYWSLTGGLWITQADGASVNGSGVTGCMTTSDVPTVGDGVVFLPCMSGAGSQWTYNNGEIVGPDGLCLEYNGGSEVETCNGSSSQKWGIFASNPGGNGNVSVIGGNLAGTSGCLQTTGPYDGYQLTEGSCSGAAAAWSLTN